MAEDTAQRRRDDARELALLIYDLFIEDNDDTATMTDGQNANQPEDD